MLGHGNSITASGRKHQVFGILSVVGGVALWFEGTDNAVTLGTRVLLFGGGLWVWGKIEEWIGR